VKSWFNAYSDVFNVVYGVYMHSLSAVTLCAMCEDTAVTEMTALPVTIGVRLRTHTVLRYPVPSVQALQCNALIALQWSSVGEVGGSVAVITYQEVSILMPVRPRPFSRFRN